MGREGEGEKGSASASVALLTAHRCAAWNKSTQLTDGLVNKEQQLGIVPVTVSFSDSAGASPFSESSGIVYTYRSIYI